MTVKKTIFLAFAVDDEHQRNFLKRQSLSTTSPFEYIDIFVKEPFESHWREQVRTNIRRSDGVIALVSGNSLSSSGQKWEITCAKEEGKELLGVWAYTNDRTNIEGVHTVVWTWNAFETFINRL